MDKYKKVGKVTIDVSINTVILATQTKWFTQSELNSNYKFTLLRSGKPRNYLRLLKLEGVTTLITDPPSATG